MPAQTASRGINVPMSSFMSGFGEEASHGVTVIASGRSFENGEAINGNFPQRHNTSNTPPPYSNFHHQHRDSTSTSASDSTDSSPTTTISTMDSSSMTEPSPGPSPESPANKQSSSSFSPDLRSRNIMTLNGDSTQQTFFELQRPMTPAKKPRNLKGLAVNTSNVLSLNRPATSGHISTVAKNESATSAPASPSFVKPLTPPRRKPAALALSLQTPANNILPARLAIPPTPSFNKPPTLRHFQSSPHLALLSPSVAPVGGMQFPPLQPFKPSPHGFSEVPMEYEEEEQEPNFDIPQSREEKPESYPNGPICIYESGVYLYMEPTADQASNYDVILNVASEVKNPFSLSIDEAQKLSKIDLDEMKSHSEPASTVDTVPADFALGALTGASTKLEVQVDSSTPTTPKASETQDKLLPPQPTLPRPSTSNRPEYIHIPWEHNTDIVPDLYRLVRIIEDRVQRKKRVLVHCQCGVSRSASLIVAYGLYKNPGITVQEAYDAVKKRSKWIGPNMNLIMQLQEFRSKVLSGNGDRTIRQQVYGMPPRKLSPGFGGQSPFGRGTTFGPRTPQTAPLPPDSISDVLMQRASTGNMEAISPGPLTAPSDLWSPGLRHSWNSTPNSFPAQTPATGPTTPRDAPQLQLPETARKVEGSHPKPADLTLGSAVVAIQPPPRSSSIRESMTERKSPPRVPNFSRPVLHDRTSDTAQQSLDSNAPPFSPRSEDFHMVGLSTQHAPADAFGILSPVSALDAKPSIQLQTQPSQHDDMFGLMSPGFGGGFPKDPFASRQSVEAEPMELCSPRATEFHMTALRPSGESDSFGLTSPRVAEFNHGPIEAPTSFYDLDQLKKEEHTTLPQHVHPIMPPTSSGAPAPAIGHPFPDINHAMKISIPSRESDESFESSGSTPTPKNPFPIPLLSLGAPPSSSAEATSHPPSADRLTAFQFPPVPPEPKQETFLKTPQLRKRLRTRFSSPNLSQQIRIHKLQTEMEAQLQNRNSQSQDDLDALMSPRATEFTRNPFHVDLGAKRQQREQQRDSPQIKGFDVPEVAPTKEDPRSPATKGSSPIVRSIWDVL